MQSVIIHPMLAAAQPPATPVYSFQQIFYGQAGVVYALAGLLQLAIAVYGICLNRTFGLKRVGWSLFSAFLLMALVHGVQSFTQTHGVTTFQTNLESIYVVICILLLAGMLNLHSALRQQVRLKLEEQRLLEALESEVLKKTDHMNRAVAALEAQVEERIRAEEQIREQARLLDLTHDAIIVQDLEEQILFWNKGAENTYGWTSAEARGQVTSQLWSAETLTFELARKTTLEKGRWQGEAAVLSKFGEKVLIDSDWILVNDAEGKPKSIMIISADITEKRKIEIQTLRSQRLESIGTLASGIAHDLNNVLTPLLMSVQLLRSKSVTGDQQKLLDTMTGNVMRGARLIKQILSFGRGIKGERIMVRLPQVAKEIEHIIHDTFPKSLEFHCQIPQGLWTVTGDATQIHQVLLNLCVNARDAMPDGGRLTLQMENVMLDKIYAEKNGEASAGAYVLINVSDTGTGIPDEILDKIFEPFFTTKEHGKGTGLGLSTCFTIVKSHGGFINAYSELGKGSSFKVYLPAESSEALKDTYSENAHNLPNGHGELVLVVDDEKPIREFAQITLEHFGYRTLAAANGAEAVSLFLAHQNEVAAVVTDVSMPVMDGPSAIVALKAINPDVRVIGTSGLEPADDRVKAGFDSFISKPYTTDALLQALERVLHSTKAGTVSAKPEISPAQPQLSDAREAMASVSDQLL